MAPKVLFVTPSNGPGGFLAAFSDQTNTVELVAVKAQAEVFADDLSARDARAAVMRARTPNGRHLALAVDIQDA